MCVCVCECTYMYVGVCPCLHTLWRPEIDVRMPFSFPFIWWARIFFTKRESQYFGWTGRPMSPYDLSACPCFQSLGLKARGNIQHKVIFPRTKFSLLFFSTFKMCCLRISYMDLVCFAQICFPFSPFQLVWIFTHSFWNSAVSTCVAAGQSMGARAATCQRSRLSSFPNS